MPSFANPWFLPLILAVPPLLWWWLRRPRSAFRYPGTGPLASLPPGRSQLARRGGAGLRATALLLLIVALSGPRWPDLRTRVPTEGIAIVMLLDVSGSMAEKDFDWHGDRVSRLFAVKKAFRLFVQGGKGSDGEPLEGRPQDQIGLVAFATRPETPCPLTLSHSVLLRTLGGEKDQEDDGDDGLKPKRIPGESETNISDAIALGLHRLQSAGPRRKVLILLSDGEHNVPLPRSGWTPRQAAQIAANLGVPIYAIDAGGEATTLQEPGAKNDSAASREEGIRTLEEVARITRGQYFRARDTQALLEVCRKIDALEREEIQSFQYRRYYEAYPWFALASFVLLVAASVLEMTVWRKVP